jgi:hypothetical protein
VAKRYHDACLRPCTRWLSTLSTTTLPVASDASAFTARADEYAQKSEQLAHVKKYPKGPRIGAIQSYGQCGQEEEASTIVPCGVFKRWNGEGANTAPLTHVNAALCDLLPAHHVLGDGRVKLSHLVLQPGHDKGVVAGVPDGRCSRGHWSPSGAGARQHTRHAGPDYERAIATLATLSRLVANMQQTLIGTHDRTRVVGMQQQLCTSPLGSSSTAAIHRAGIRQHNHAPCVRVPDGRPRVRTGAEGGDWGPGPHEFTPRTTNW